MLSSFRARRTKVTSQQVFEESRASCDGAQLIKNMRVVRFRVYRLVRFRTSANFPPNIGCGSDSVFGRSLQQISFTPDSDRQSGRGGTSYLGQSGRSPGQPTRQYAHRMSTPANPPHGAPRSEKRQAPARNPRRKIAGRSGMKGAILKLVPRRPWLLRVGQFLQAPLRAVRN